MTSNTNPILEYSATISPPRMLTLQEGDGEIQVIFPVSPMWVYWLPIYMGIALGVLKLAGAVFIVERIWSLWSQMGKFGPLPSDASEALRRMVLEIILPACFVALFWWAFAAYKWWELQRWGRVPRVLTANERGLKMSRLGMFRMHERRWGRDEIKSIEFRPVRGNLNWRRTTADLYVHRREGWRLRFRLSSRDRELPSRIARLIANKLGLPLIYAQATEGHPEI